MVTESKESTTVDVPVVERNIDKNIDKSSNSLETVEEIVTQEKCLVMDIERDGSGVPSGVNAGVIVEREVLKTNLDVDQPSVLELNLENVGVVMTTEMEVSEGNTEGDVVSIEKIDTAGHVNVMRTDTEDAGDKVAEVVDSKEASIVASESNLDETKVPQAESQVTSEDGKEVDSEPMQAETTVPDLESQSLCANATIADLKETEENQEIHTKSAAPTASVTNSSLGLLSQYAGTSSEEDGDDEEEENEAQEEANATKQLFEKIFTQTNYRTVSSDDEDSETDSDSDVEFVGVQAAEVIQINDEEEDYSALYENLQTGILAEDAEKPSGPIKAKGEFGLDDLPPIAELTITVSEDECIVLGNVSGTVDTLVLVESLPNFAAVDIDTVLFLDKGDRTLGQVFDVMGNVANPIYCVRFNKREDIEEKGIVPGLKVYVAPRTEHTNFIVLSDLMKQKGCDASWEDDIEPPPGIGEFSDDEEELQARRNARHQKRQQRTRTESASTDASGTDLPNKRPMNNVNPRRNQNRQQNAQNKRGGHNFYKDNRDYATMGQGSSYNCYPPQPFQFDHSWHTAALQGPPPPPPANVPNAGPSGHVYPNPYSHQFQQPPSGSAGPFNPFNPQAFPPLPPPGALNNPPFNRNRQNPRFSNYNQRNRQNRF